VHSGYAEGEALGVGRGLCPILAHPLVGTVGRQPRLEGGEAPSLQKHHKHGAITPNHA